jgi:hypothetical protein
VQQVEYFEDIAEAREGADPRATWYKIEPLSLVVDRLVSFHIRSHVALYAQIDGVLAELRDTKTRPQGSLSCSLYRVSPDLRHARALR